MYFYPKADTPSCTARIYALRDAFEAFKAQKPQITRASRISRVAQKTFHSKYNIPFPLIVGANRAVAAAFGTPLLMGIYSSRQASILNENREVVWKSLKAVTCSSTIEVQTALDFLAKKASTQRKNSKPQKDWVDSSTVEQRPFKALVLGSSPSQPI